MQELEEIVAALEKSSVSLDESSSFSSAARR